MRLRARFLLFMGITWLEGRTIGDALDMVQNENAGDAYMLWHVDGYAYSSGFVRVAEKGSMKLHRYVEA